jgi:hypothetical protein
MTLHEITHSEGPGRHFSIKGDANQFMISINGTASEWLPGDLEPTQVAMPTINNQDLAHMFVGIAARLLAQPYDHAMR